MGPFVLYRNDDLVDTSKWQRRVATLFKLLILAPERRRLRDEIIDVIWPDASPDTASGNLRVLVHRLRGALGGGDPSPVISEGGWVLLNPQYGWNVDLDTFQDLVERANGNVEPLLQAAELIRGETLPEDRYDDWATSIREHVHRTQRGLYLTLAAIYEAQAAYDDAVVWFEQARVSDPYDEEAVRGLLNVLVLAGRRTDAVRRYAQFEAGLKEEMDVAPSPETQAVAARIRSGDGDISLPGDSRIGGGAVAQPPSGHFLGAAPPNTLVGRKDEIERIQVAIDSVSAGTGRLITLAGEAGAGKTRLAQEAWMHLRERGFLVATGRCHARDLGGADGRSGELYPFIDVLAVAQAQASPALRVEIPIRWPELAHILPISRTRLDIGDRSGGAQSQPDKTIRVIADFFLTLSDQQPVAILLDDLHHADEMSVNLLEELARRTHNCRVLLIATYRDEEVDRDQPLGQALREMSREGLVERIPVPRLSVEATAALVAETMGDVAEPEDFVDFVYRRTKGNPYYIERMLNSLAGRYRLVRQIGAGGMGRVFEAVDARTGRHVAVKLMFARTEADPQALRRFEHEGEVLTGLRHPNIVRVYGHFLDEYSGCIVMELLPGQPLGRILRSEPIPLSRVQSLLGQVASALAFAHERGIVHRDIKPDNIMVDKDGTVKVTDFGIARMVRSHSAATTLTSRGLTIGTPLYMAPEQIEGRKIDGRADIYSLGAVFYSMVAGRPPFESDDPLALAYKQVHETPVPPTSYNPDLPASWEVVILRALAKDPTARFSSAETMLEAMKALPPAQGVTPLLGTVKALDPAMAPSTLGEGVPSAKPASRTESTPPPTPSLGGVATVPATTRLRRTRIGGAAVGMAALAVAAVLGGRALTSQTAVRATPVPTLTVAVKHSIPSLWGASGTDPGEFEGPAGAGTDAQGNLWVADSTNDRVQEFSPTSKLLHVLGSRGTGHGQFIGPTDVAVDPTGNIYVADPTNGRIEKFSPQRRWLATIRVDRPGSQIGTALSSVSVDRLGNLYASDYSSNQVRKFSPTGTLLLSWGSKGHGMGQFVSPDGIAVDQRNNVVYVADKFNRRIQKFSLDGVFLRAWGNRGSLHGQFDGPADIAVDTNGNVYVADTQNHRVQEFSPSGQFIRTWGTNGSGYLKFHLPSGVAIGAGNILYVTDFFNNRVERIVTSGK